MATADTSDVFKQEFKRFRRPTDQDMKDLIDFSQDEDKKVKCTLYNFMHINKCIIITNTCIYCYRGCTQYLFTVHPSVVAIATLLVGAVH